MIHQCSENTGTAWIEYASGVWALWIALYGGKVGVAIRCCPFCGVELKGGG